MQDARPGFAAKPKPRVRSRRHLRQGSLCLIHPAVIHIKGCRAQTPRLKRGSLGDPAGLLPATSLQPE